MLSMMYHRNLKRYALFLLCCDLPEAVRYILNLDKYMLNIIMCVKYLACMYNYAVYINIEECTNALPNIYSFGINKKNDRKI